MSPGLIMLSLFGQQRRLASGSMPHISFSRSPGGLLESCASGGSDRSVSISSGRTSRRCSSEQKHQHDSSHAGSSHKSSGTAGPHSRHHRSSSELLLQRVGHLGVVRGSEVPQGQPGEAKESDLDRSHHSSRNSSRSGSFSRSNSACRTETPDSSRDTLSPSTSLPSGSSPTCSELTSSSSGQISTGVSTGVSTSAGDEGSDSGGGSDDWQQDEAVVAAMNHLSRFLDFRERCAWEVLNKLSEMGYNKEMARRVLARLQKAGLQDDARFAELYAYTCWKTKAQAPSKIAYELRARRVAQEHIDAALTAVFGDSQQLPHNREANNDQQDAAWQELVEACRRRAELSVGELQQKRRAKLATWLQRRGHSLATAFKMFEELGI